MLGGGVDGGDEKAAARSLQADMLGKLNRDAQNSGAADVALGITVGIFGIIGCSVNYPIYKEMLDNGKKKYAFEIIELAKEISGEE